MILLLACAPDLPEPPAVVALEGVEVVDPPLVVHAASATVEGSTARSTSVQVAAEGAPPLDIRAARSEWDLRSRRVRFSGGVSVTRGDVTLTCAALEVVYADAKTVDHIVATGGVHVARGERTADAERGELYGATGEIRLTGHPVLTEGPNRLVGERISLFLDAETATCDGGAEGPCRLLIAGEALPGRRP